MKNIGRRVSEDRGKKFDVRCAGRVELPAFGMGGAAGPGKMAINGIKNYLH